MFDQISLAAGAALISAGFGIGRIRRSRPAENPTAQIAGGQLVFDIDVMPPPPAERITFQAFIDGHRKLYAE